MFKGGLKSLIPRLGVDSADDVVDRLEEEEKELRTNDAAGSGHTGGEENGGEGEAAANKKGAGQRVSVVGEDSSPASGQAESEARDGTSVRSGKSSPAKRKMQDVQTRTKEEEKEDSGTEAGAEEEKTLRPKQPLVTPLTVDGGEEEETSGGGEEREKEGEGTPAGSARQPDEELLDNVVSSEDRKGAAWDKHEEKVRSVIIRDIETNPTQPRRHFDKAEMQELMDSIAQHGILQPLVVRRHGDKYQLVAGERRLKAAQQLGWERVPCVVRRGVGEDSTRLEMALIENIQRENLNPVEEAMAYKRLCDEYGMTHHEIGERIGRSRVSITNMLRVLQLPKVIRQGLTDGVISAGHARAILMIPDEEKQKRFYSHLVAEGLTVRKAETRARRIQRAMEVDDSARRSRGGRTPFESKYSGELEDRYGYNARVSFSPEKNHYEIRFRCYSRGDVNELLGRLLGTKPLPQGEDDV